ncbi:MAG: hypothetical protein MUE54_08195 [Anaerolineae bacterium]|jgi:hypothetical protein|nr:hypothetical protein [Anaerolineae bacterium]
MPTIYGNGLGILMFMMCALPALVGGLLMRLPDPIVMGFVGVMLVAMDMVIRIRNRNQTGWLMKKELGGYLYFIPVWVLGVFVIILNIVNAIRPLDL